MAVFNSSRPVKMNAINVFHNKHPTIQFSDALIDTISVSNLLHTNMLCYSVINFNMNNHLPCCPECWEQSLLHHPHWQLWGKKRVHIIIKLNNNTKQVIFCETPPGIKINHPLCMLVWYWPLVLTSCIQYNFQMLVFVWKLSQHVKLD